MSSDAVDRREFLRGTARLALAGGLLGGCALLVLKKPVGGGGDCIKAIACSSCGQLGTCALPKAGAWRHQAQGTNGEGTEGDRVAAGERPQSAIGDRQSAIAEVGHG